MFLITGATGFLGRTLTDALCRDERVGPSRLAVLVRDPDKWKAQATGPQAGIATIRGQLEDTRSWAPEASRLGVRGIFHLAATVRHSRRAEDVAATWQTNVEGTRAIAALAQKLPARVVFVSSSGTVGCSKDATSRPDEDAPFAYDTVSQWPYYRSKIAAEQVAREALPSAQQLVIVRPPILLGPGDTLFRSTSTLVRFLRGRVPFVLKGGIAMVDVRDVAHVLQEAMLKPEVMPIYHVPGYDMSLRAYFGHVARLSHRKAPRLRLPRAAAMSVARASAMVAKWRGHEHAALEPVTVEMGHHFWGVSSRHVTSLGYSPRPLNDTLRETIADLCARRDDCGAAVSAQPSVAAPSAAEMAAPDIG